MDENKNYRIVENFYCGANEEIKSYYTVEKRQISIIGSIFSLPKYYWKTITTLEGWGGDVYRTTLQFKTLTAAVEYVNNVMQKKPEDKVVRYM